VLGFGLEMATPNQGDMFDAYFRRADLDRDGRISGAEAVAFFQGSNLPKQVLAQVCLFILPLSYAVVKWVLVISWN